MRAWTYRIGLAVGSVCLTLLVAEVALRVKTEGGFSLKNRYEAQRNLLVAAYPGILDPDLGWIPKPHSSGRKNVWKTEVTIGEAGIRSNGSTVRYPPHPSILAVGDSFTFGDEVSDDETWPAALERKLGVRVINGGVFNYGLDQIVLRAEALIDRYRPEIVILSFISEDVIRVRQSMRSGLAKPYFLVVDGELVLKNHPVATDIGLESRRYRIGPVKKVLGYSFLAHEIMLRIAPGYWLLGSDWASAKVDNDPIEVSCKLMERFERTISERGIIGIVMPQFGRALDPIRINVVDLVMRCVPGGLRVLNVFDQLKNLETTQRDVFEGLYRSPHMSPDGNAFVARELAAFLKASQLLPGSTPR